MKRKYYQIIVAVLIFITVVLFVSMSAVNIDIVTENAPENIKIPELPGIDSHA